MCRNFFDDFVKVPPAHADTLYMSNNTTTAQDAAVLAVLDADPVADEVLADDAGTVWADFEGTSFDLDAGVWNPSEEC